MNYSRAVLFRLIEPYVSAIIPFGNKSGETMTTEILGELVKKRRKELGMNQHELALVSGTGVRFISDLENGKATCELGKTLDVLVNLGVEIELKPKSGGK